MGHKILFLVVFLATLSMAQWKTYVAVVDSGDSVSSAIVLDQGFRIEALETTALAEGSDSLGFDVKGQQNTATWRQLFAPANGANPFFFGGHFYMPLDTTGKAFLIDDEALDGWQVIRGVLPVVQTEDDTIFFHAVKSQHH